MAKVQLDDGRVLEFQGDPTPQDVEEATSSTPSSAQPSSQSASPSFPAPGWLRGASRETGIWAGNFGNTALGGVPDWAYQKIAGKSFLPTPENPDERLAQIAGQGEGAYFGLPGKIAGGITRFVGGANPGILRTATSMAAGGAALPVASDVTAPLDVQKSRAGLGAIAGGVTGLVAAPFLIGSRASGQIKDLMDTQRNAPFATTQKIRDIQQELSGQEATIGSNIEGLQKSIPTQADLIAQDFRRGGTLNKPLMDYMHGENVAYGNALESAIGSVQKPIPASDVLNEVAQRYGADSPELRQVWGRLSKQMPGMGAEEGLNITTPTGGSPQILGAQSGLLNQPVDPSKLREIVKDLHQEIPSNVWAGKTAMDADQLTTSHVAQSVGNVLQRYMSPEGVEGLQQANQRWANYVPLRDQIFKTFQPTSSVTAPTTPATSFLMDYAKGTPSPEFPSQQRLMQLLEEKTNAPIGTGLQSKYGQIAGSQADLESARSQAAANIQNVKDTAAHEAVNRSEQLADLREKTWAPRMIRNLMERWGVYRILGGAKSGLSGK